MCFLRTKTFVNAKMIICRSNWKYQVWKTFVMYMNMFSSYYFIRRSITTRVDVSLKTRIDLGSLIFQFIFYIDMLINFFTQKEVFKHGVLVNLNNFNDIARTYHKTNFLFDFVTLFPFWEICYDRFEKFEYVLLIKCLRIKNGLQAIDSNLYIIAIRNITKKRA